MFKDLAYNSFHTFMLVFRLYAPMLLAVYIADNWKTFTVFHIIIYSALSAVLFVIVFYDFIKPNWKTSKHNSKA